MGTLKNPSSFLNGGGKISGDTEIEGNFDITSGDLGLSESTVIRFPDDVGSKTLVDFTVTDQPAQGTDQLYSFEIDGNDILRVRAEADGAGGVQNLTTDVPVDLVVDGSTTEVDNVVTGDILVEDGAGNNLVRFDSTVDPVIIDYFGNTIQSVGQILFGSNDDMSARYDSNNDSMRWQDQGNSADRMDLDRTSGDLNIEGNFTEGAAL